MEFAARYKDLEEHLYSNALLQYQGWLHKDILSRGVAGTKWRLGRPLWSSLYRENCGGLMIVLYIYFDRIEMQLC
jgi:hypothetical protein